MTSHSSLNLNTSLTNDINTKDKKILYWPFLLIIMFIFDDMFDELKDDLITIANDYKRVYRINMAEKNIPRDCI